MTLQTLNKFRPWPGNYVLDAVPAIGASSTLSAAGHYEAFLVQASEVMAISHAAIKCNSVSGSPTAVITIEGVDATTGLPNGVVIATLTTGVLTTSWATYPFDVTANFAIGDLFYYKIAYNSGTSFTISGISNAPGNAAAFPPRAINTGTPTKGSTVIRCMLLGSSASSFYCIDALWAASSISATTFTSASNPDRRGMIFTLPFKAQLCGVQFYPGSSIGNIIAAAFDNAGTQLSAIAIDGDYFSGFAGAAGKVLFSTPVILSAGTPYRVTIEAASATAVGFATYTMSSVNYMGATPGGPNCHYTFSNDGGAFDDTSTLIVPFMDILIRQLDDGINAAGGKGLLT